jgi:serine/threonine protein kinase
MPRTLYKNFLYQILEGLKYCVEKKVVHGNLKPKNVILFENFEYDKLTENNQRKNSRYILKLTDFKIDRVTESHSDFSSIIYKSPEVILKNNLNSYRNYSMDIWSAACIFYEMVTGVPLFNEKYDNRFDLFKHVMEVTNTTDEKFKNMFASEYWTLKEVFNDEIKPRRNPLILLENKFVPCEMELFKNMLCFNPLTRIHAFSALKTNYFRSQSLEIEDDVIDSINNNITNITNIINTINNTTNDNSCNNTNKTKSNKCNNSNNSINNSSNKD